MWEQTDTGPWEAIVSDVRALNETARWVRLEVDPPPPLDGPGGRSLAKAEVGCASEGATFAENALCAQIAPEKGEQESIVFHVPALLSPGRYTARFEIRGNFPTVRVSVPMIVEPA